MHRVLLLGAGKIGSTIADFLLRTGEYGVTVADLDARALKRVESEFDGHDHLRTLSLDVGDEAALAGALGSQETVVSALSFSHNVAVARAALAHGCSYFDLTEDVETTKRVKQVAAGAGRGQVFMPQCGLAPGFVSIAAYDLFQRFDGLDAIHMRVGALPLYPDNAMKYNLTWSTDGLINEYCNVCDAIIDGSLRGVLPLEGMEEFSLDGVRYEAFNTSGGLGTLAETLAGKVRELNYKTIRYLGHRDLMSFLVNELRLCERRHILKDILETAIPITHQDVVVVFCTARGQRGGELVQETDARKIYHGEAFGKHRSAIQITTAAGLCAVLDMHVAGKLPGRGFVRQEEVALSDFLANRFGRLYGDRQAARFSGYSSPRQGESDAPERVAPTGR